MKRVLGFLSLGFAAALPQTKAVVLTWSGATGGSFSTASNWVDSALPGSGDAVEFTNVVTNTTVSFTGPGTTTVGNMTFSGTSRPAYTFGGTGSPTLSLTGNVTLTTVGDVSFASTLTLNLASGSTFNVTSGATVTIEGIVGGAVGITKTGAGTLVLANSGNSYIDPTYVKEGVLSVSSLGTASGASSLGNDNSIADYLFVRLGNLTTTGTLKYTGNASVSTNRGIDMAGSTGGATLDASGTGAVTFSSFRVSVSGAKAFTLTGTSNATNTVSAEIKNSVDGATRLVKEGTGTWKLTGPNTYTGGTTISGGKLIADHNTALGTGSVTLSGGTLNIASGRTLANSLSFTSTGNASVLAGNGTLSSAVSATTNSVLAPGDSIGTLNFSNGLTLGTGSAISFEIQNPSGAAGTGYDLLNVTNGSISLTATTNTITFNVITLDTNGARGALQAFDPAQAYSWSFAALSAGNTAGSITGFSAGQFNLVTTDFTNSLAGGSFSFSLSNDSRSLLLNFTPVPEPETYVLMGTGLSLLAGAAWRRRRR
ncbi:MAG TPA: autotransporter-associated beta strand repeat-containing protein [Opitutaceae bacterium]